MRPHKKIEAINALFRATLAGGYDGDKSWSAVRYLRQHGNRFIFEKAAAWCVSKDPHKRARGADILCQLRRPKSTAEGSVPGFHPRLRFSFRSPLKFFRVSSRTSTMNKRSAPLYSAWDIFTTRPRCRSSYLSRIIQVMRYVSQSPAHSATSLRIWQPLKRSYPSPPMRMPMYAIGPLSL